MSHKLAGRRVLVTGASSGMGRSTALRMVAEGATGMALVDINPDGLADVSKELAGSGASVVTYAVDLADRARARQAVKDAIADLGGLDVIVSNAATNVKQAFVDVEDETFDRLMAVDFTAGFVIAQEAARHMIKTGSGGVILFTTALMEKGGIMDTPVYCAAKAALINLVKCLAPALGPHGIRVNCVSPGFTNTPLWGLRGRNEMATRLPKIMPLRRTGIPEDIAAAFVFLASDDASYITGENLHVEGGVTAEAISVPWREAVEGRLLHPDSATAH